MIAIAVAKTVALLTLLVGVCGHVWLQRQRRRTSGHEVALLGGLSAAGIFAVWGLLAGAAPALRVGAVCVHAAGWVIYMELRSLLCRGYSLRVLLDLLERPTTTVEHLKTAYGGGRGVDGLVIKRLHSLVQLGLVRQHGERVGPLTGLGRALAAMGAGMRRLLRLELVG